MFGLGYKGRVNEKGCEKFHEFQKEVNHQISMVPMSMISNLYKSMPRRIKLVVENNGGKTKY